MKVIKTIATVLLAAGVVLLFILVLQSFGVIKPQIGSGASASETSQVSGGASDGGAAPVPRGLSGLHRLGGGSAGGEMNAVYAVNTSKAVRGTIRGYIKLNGDITAKASVDVVSDRGGKLSRIAVALGERVAKDQIIAEVDPSTPGNQLAPVPVRSSISGIVTTVKGTVGQAVSIGTPIISVSGSEGVEAKAFVPERYVGSVKQGAEADVTFDAYPDVTFKFRVTALSPVLDPASRTMEIRLEPAVPDSRIKAGMFARISLVTEKRSGVVKILTSGLVTQEGKTYIYIVDENSVAKKTPVTLGLKVDGVAEAISGVAPGDNVVVAGHTLLDDGMKVNVVKEVDPPADSSESILSVKTAKVTSGEMSASIRTNGSVVSKTAVAVLPDASGKLTQLFVKLGDRVEKGQVIAEVDASKPGLQFVPSKVTAPISGIITTLPVQVGATVAVTTSLALISNPEDFHIKAEVPERSIYKLKIGQPVFFKLDAYPAVRFSGTVAEIDPEVNPLTQTVKVGVKLDTVDERIKAGMFAQIEIITDRSPNAVIVPREALMDSSNGYSVFVVRKDLTVERRTVRTGILTDDAAEILSGLSVGEDVIVQGQGLVQEGGRVNIIERSAGLRPSEFLIPRTAMEAAQ